MGEKLNVSFKRFLAKVFDPKRNYDTAGQNDTVSSMFVNSDLFDTEDDTPLPQGIFNMIRPLMF